MAWEDPGKEFVDGGGGQLFANLRAAYSPSEIRTGLDQLDNTVSGATPDEVFEHTLMPAVETLREAQDLYRVGEGGFNQLHSAVYGWHTKAETGGFNAAGMEAAEARSRAAQAVIADAVNDGREPTAEEGAEARDATTDLAKKIRERESADAALTADMARIATNLAESAKFLGETLILPIIDSDGTPAGAPDCAVNHLRGSHGSPGGPASPRIAPASAAPGPAPSRSPEAQARIADLLKELQQQGQPQQQQQPQPVAAGAPAASPAAAQGKPAEKPESGGDALQQALDDAARNRAADFAPLAAAAAVTPAAAGGAPIAPAAPKRRPQAAGRWHPTTSTNVSGGQQAAPRVTLSGAEPVQDTRAAGQRTGAAPMGGGGVPVAPGYGGGGQQGAGNKAPEKVVPYRRASETELIATGAYTRAEAVRGGTLIRGDEGDEDPRKRGPRKR
ncbi:hypothetical protein [Mycolicibacterium fallax]|uniref:hypothetical protein n=1 Tax=Mycolicibacterium fallax TaxID=1793 RepID=UPI0021F2D225|nr:hypothetical protein [Mycolicibacterium fallax]